MNSQKGRAFLDRRSFFKLSAGGLAGSLISPLPQFKRIPPLPTTIFSVTDIPDHPWDAADDPNYHVGFEALLRLMDSGGLKFYRAIPNGLLRGPLGLIAPDDIVLIKVNAQWKYRGATNSDLVRGIVQRVLDHPDGFRGEVVIMENGQGRGSLNCDTTGSGYPDDAIHANALDESHSFLFLIHTIFRDPRVSAMLLDPYRRTFIGADDHLSNGYRRLENVSYPCFTTSGGRRVELKEGVWNGSGYEAKLKLINVPVLKTHGGSEITASLKHFYGILSMDDGQSNYRHYVGLGETCGKMVVSVRTPVLNIMDAIWVSHRSLGGYPANTTFKANRIAASQDPLALDYWTAKNILFPIDRNSAHDPDNAVISNWMDIAAGIINDRGGLFNPEQGIFVDRVTRREERMWILQRAAGTVGTGETTER